MCKRKLVLNQVGSYCKVTETKRFYNALLQDQATRIFQVDKIVLRHLFFAILSSISAYAIIER